MMHLPLSAMTELQDKQIVVLGLGLTGLSCVRFLHAHNIACAVNDSRIAPTDIEKFNQEFTGIKAITGKWDSQLISQAEVLIVSPGIDLSQAEIAGSISKKCQVWGDVELFCRMNNVSKQYPILAITGSNGKSTVVSLLAHLGESLGVKVQLGGNIGQPVLDLLTPSNVKDSQSIKPNDKQSTVQELSLLIFELSSFQLETLTSMHALAASVLNVSDDHLDRHVTLDNYQAIKQGIYSQSEFAVINRDDVRTKTLMNAQKIISFGSDKPAQGHFGIVTGKGNAEQTSTTQLMFGEQLLIALDDLPLAGIHNGLNYLAALALGYSAGWPLSEMVRHLSGFTGLAHRCQRVASNDAIFWVNDSKATNVGATIAAINGLASTMGNKQKLILIAGGIGKGADFSPLQQPLEQHVSHLITLGKDGEQIASLVHQSVLPVTCSVASVAQAVAVARKLASSGDIVMLSPACASFDMFKGFAARGDAFIAAVQHIAEAS